MPRNYINYANQRLYVSPSPGSGDHFLSTGGILNDEYYNLENNYNLVFPIDRVQNFSYQINVDRQEIQRLGQRGAIRRPIVEKPSIELSFDYLPIGIRNELRLGLYCNYSRLDGAYNGQAFFSGDGFGACPISGLTVKDLQIDPSTNWNWPYTYRDNKNFYLSVSSFGTDARRPIPNEDFTESGRVYYVDSGAINDSVLGFGGCYLTSYSTTAEVGRFPLCSTSWTCESMSYSTSGSGFQIPTLDPKSYSGINKHVVLPPTFRQDGYSTILPGDIIVTISGANGTTVDNHGFAFNDIKIRSYQIDFTLNREPLRSIGYVLPIYREINFPVISNASFSFYVGDIESGALNYLVNNDLDYFISIKQLEPISSLFTGGSNLILHGGTWTGERRISREYDLRGAKFQGASYGVEVGNNAVIAQLSYSTQLIPENRSTGLFLSGQLHIDKLDSYLLDSSGRYVVTGLQLFNVRAIPVY